MHIHFVFEIFSLVRKIFKTTSYDGSVVGVSNVIDEFYIHFYSLCDMVKDFL